MKSILYVFLLMLLFSPFSWSAAEKIPKDVITSEKAQKIALEKYPGTLKDSELEKEEGKWVYSFDIVDSRNIIHEVWVNAKTGKIAKHSIESSKNEAAEQKLEK